MCGHHHNKFPTIINSNPEKAENMRWLSSRQALADAAYFIKYAIKKFHLTVGTKWIAVGGSYSGNS
jgi:hypothetical protein